MLLFVELVRISSIPTLPDSSEPGRRRDLPDKYGDYCIDNTKKGQIEADHSGNDCTSPEGLREKGGQGTTQMNEKLGRATGVGARSMGCHTMVWHWQRPFPSQSCGERAGRDLLPHKHCALFLGPHYVG